MMHITDFAESPWPPRQPFARRVASARLKPALLYASGDEEEFCQWGKVGV
jgi:hypothetical protein